MVWHRPGGTQQLDLPLGQESTDRQGPFVCNVASVQLPGMRRSGEISGIAERQLGSGTEWKTAGEIDPIHPRSGFDAYSDGLPAVREGAGGKGQRGKDDILRRPMAEHDGARTPADETDRRIRWWRSCRLQDDHPRQC